MRKILAALLAAIMLSFAASAGDVFRMEAK